MDRRILCIPGGQLTRPRRTFDHVKGGRRADLGFHVRSKAEANYARYLKWMEVQGYARKWAYEPHTFWFNEPRGTGLGVKRGVVSYIPDFWVEWGVKADHPGEEFIEIKGFMDRQSATKIKRFGIYYPEKRLKVITTKQVSQMGRNLGKIIPGWE